MLLFVLRLLEPTNIPNRKSEWNRSLRLYYWLLVKLMPAYRRSAISETILLGDIKIIHNFRDTWYENVLKRFKIETAQHIEKHTLPYNNKLKYRYSRRFRWTETLQVFCGEKYYNIKRTDGFSIETDMEGTFKLSTLKDFIIRSEFSSKYTITSSKNTETHNNPTSDKQSTSFQQEKPKAKQKINIKDTIPNSSDPFEKTTTTRHQGFEENDIF